MHPRTHELLDYLERQRAVLRTAFDTVAPPLRDRSPAIGRWSTAGVIEHLAIVEQRVSGRLSAALTHAREKGLPAESSTVPLLPSINVAPLIDRTTRITAPEAAQPTGLGAEAAWTALEQAGLLVRDTARTCDGWAVGTVLVPHPVFGPISLYHWFAFVGAHEARHAAQIHEIAATFVSIS